MVICKGGVHFTLFALDTKISSHGSDFKGPPFGSHF